MRTDERGHDGICGFHAGSELLNHVVGTVALLGLAQTGDAEILFTVNKLETSQCMHGKPLVNELT
jgi:hypothetical protein